MVVIATSIFVTVTVRVLLVCKQTERTASTERGHERRTRDIRHLSSRKSSTTTGTSPGVEGSRWRIS